MALMTFLLGTTARVVMSLLEVLAEACKNDEYEGLEYYSRLNST